MEDFARANVGNGKTSEDDVWAILHAENIRRGGEWIETRLLTSGQRDQPVVPRMRTHGLRKATRSSALTPTLLDHTESALISRAVGGLGIKNHPLK